MNAATKVFGIPELLEMILLSIPADTIHSEFAALRTIYLGQSTCRNWRTLVLESPRLRQQLYLPTTQDIHESQLSWSTKSPFPPARPNPCLPHLLLHQRSWGSAWPFDDNDAYTATLTGIDPSAPRHWTFSFEMSRAQWSRRPGTPGPWREMLACSPPFRGFWATRAFYELGSGRAPFVTHLDYDPEVAKSAQRYAGRREGGVTLGDVVDVVTELFESDQVAKFVMVESVLGEGRVMIEEEGPRTRSYMPGSSAERESGWGRG